MLGSKFKVFLKIAMTMIMYKDIHTHTTNLQVILTIYKHKLKNF
jgi:hypothetical protein